MKNVKKISTRFAGIMAVMIFALTLSGCLDSDSDSDFPNVPVAYVALYQGSPDAPHLDIKTERGQVNTNPFKYSDYTGYLPFNIGERQLKFGPYNASNIQFDSTVTLEKNKIYSVFVSGNYANAGLVILNDNSTEPAAGKAKLRVINLSPDVPEISLNINTQTDALVEDLAFQEASAFEEITAQRYDFQVKSEDDVLLTVPNINLQRGYFYTIVIRGYVQPPGENTNVLAAQVIVNQL